MGLRIEGRIRIPDGRALYDAHLEAAKTTLPQLVKRQIESQRAPTGGRRWPARRQDYAWAPLKRTGALIGSIALERDGDSVVVTVDVPYSGFHQDTAPRHVLPARRFLPIGDAMPASWQRAIEQAPPVQRVWRGVTLETVEVYGP